MSALQPPEADTQAILDLLDRHRERPGSIELFDALLVADPVPVAGLLARYARHPAAGRLGEWLAARGVAAPPPPSAETILEKHGIEDLEEHLAVNARLLGKLQAGLDEAWGRAERAESVSNALAAVLVLMVFLAVIGWAGALGMFSLFSPAPPEKEPAAQQRGKGQGAPGVPAPSLPDPLPTGR